MDNIKIKTDVNQFTNEELEKIKDNDQNVVYDVVFDKVDRVLPMAEVKQVLGVIRGLYESLKKSNTDLSDDEIRDIIKVKSKEAKLMAEKTHPKMFLKVTDKNSTDDDFKKLSYFISLREQVETGKLTHDEAGAAMYQSMQT